jgi:hypothetical protein
MSRTPATTAWTGSSRGEGTHGHPCFAPLSPCRCGMGEGPGVRAPQPGGEYHDGTPVHGSSDPGVDGELASIADFC